MLKYDVTAYYQMRIPHKPSYYFSSLRVEIFFSKLFSQIALWSHFPTISVVKIAECEKKMQKLLAKRLPLAFNHSLLS